MSALTYWLSQLLADASLCLLSLGACFAAVLCGGAPTSSYFLSLGASSGGAALLLLCGCAFSDAVAASSHALVALSTDPLSSQLVCLLSTITGGLFLKLFLDRHHSPLYSAAGLVFNSLSP